MAGEIPSDYDAIVVGSGFAGSWAAKELAEAGFRTILFEAGPPRSPDDIPARTSDATINLAALGGFASRRHKSVAMPSNEVAPSLGTRQQVQSRHPGFSLRGPHLFVDDADHPYQTTPDLPYYWIRGMQVGGRSLTWGGTALRLSPYEFDAPTLDECELRWPIRYEQLADAYTAVETMTIVRGTPEGLPQLPDSAFQLLGVRLTPAEKDFQQAHRETGTRPIPVRFIPAVATENGWPAYTMQATALAAASRSRYFVCRTESVVTKVTVDEATGLATGVRYVDTKTGTWHHAASRVVFLCCGAIETARLMLNSRSARHPHGLGNSSGWVGRGLMDHPVISSLGVLDGYSSAHGYDQSPRQAGLIVPPQPSNGGNVRPFGMWVNLQRQANSTGVESSSRAIGSLDAQGEMLPRWQNRVRLSTTRDQWGVPVPLIECAYGPHEQRLLDAMHRAVIHAASVAGLRITALTDRFTVPGLNAHELGTARMGSTARTSVVDSQNRCWDCPNVFVTDGSCFPSSGWQNPTLTIMALSYRAGRCATELLRNSLLFVWAVD